MRRVAFMTYEGQPEITADDRLGARALERRGYRVESLVWDHHHEDLTQLDAVLLRSCWDYHEKTAAFRRWLEEMGRQGVRLLNGPEVCLRTIAKTYLRDLDAAGIPVPRAAWIPAGSVETLASVLETHGLDEAVVKPVVSMCGLDTWRTSRELAHDHEAEWRRLVTTRDLLVQEYLAEIVDGELSFVFFDRAFSHAVRKTPRPGELRVHEEYGGTRAPFVPDANVLAQARRVLDGVEGALTWARVDGVLVGGKLVLMELEVIDPTLFFAYDDGAADRFAGAVDRAIAARRPPA